MEIQLTETIFIAIITASVSFVGAIAGIITALITSKLSANARLSEIAVQASINAQIEKYSAFLDTCIAFEQNFESPDAKAAMISALNTASVVASEKTAKLMVIYHCQLLALDFRSENTRQAKHNLLSSMQSDTHTIRRPKIKRW